MNTHSKLSERSDLAGAIYPQDINAAPVTSAYVSMAKHRIVRAFALAYQIATTKKITIQLFQATDAAGTGAKALSAAVDSVNTTGGALDLTAEVEARVEELDVANGFTHVAVRLSTDNGAGVDGAAILERGDMRYTPSA